jgi:hypothetical protein
MNPQLERALVAADEGRKDEAQVLLARVIKEEPKNSQAWFLLSKLVNSDRQRITFLRKVLAIEPGHEEARRWLAELAPEPVAGEEATVPPAASTAEPAGPTADHPASMEMAEASNGQPAVAVVEETTVVVVRSLEPTGEEAVEMTFSQAGPPEPPPAGVFEETIAEEWPISESSPPESAPADVFEESIAEEWPVSESSLAESAPAEAGHETAVEESPAEPAMPGAMPISTDPLDFLAQSEANTLPPWMAEDDPKTAAMAATAVAPAEAKREAPAADVPDWLRHDLQEGWSESKEPESRRVLWRSGQVEPSGPAEPAGSPAADGPAGEAAKGRGFAASNLFLGLLIILAIAVLLVLLYSLYQLVV